ncbi:MAG: hypothetical protein AUI11_05475 [Acidobacteria bacterium 13_2_20CM_2_66_4]|nr:MAG: hypothetical protein AUI11_05475 [Acidobacteria bacterium 13_2_20CM_2_66_4]
MSAAAVAGLAIMIVSEAATIARIEPFYSWNTPICWTGFILFADTIVYRARGRSWMRSSPREFALLAILSIPLWIVFEGYNLIIRNWYYTGLPENWFLRMFGYAWSFATIWPAIFEGADLISVWAGPAGGAGWARAAGGATAAGDGRRTFPPAGHPAPCSSRGRSLSIAIGTAMLLVPFLVSRDVARYLAAPVWLGFIFLLDPINSRLGGATLMADRHQTADLLGSGLLCGVLWEVWNFWAGTKWHYTVPIMEDWKVFEMPLPGYLGFPPFALECFTMYVFVRLMFQRLGS